MGMGKGLLDSLIDFDIQLGWEIELIIWIVQGLESSTNMAHTTIVVFCLLAITGNSCIVEVQTQLAYFFVGDGVAIRKYEVKVQYGQLYGFVAYTLLMPIDFSYLKQLHIFCDVI